MNLYPVKVVRADGAIVRNCRLVSEGGLTQLWEWPPDADEPRVLVEDRSEPARVGATSAYLVDGLRVDPQRGCGCGHRMQTWVPPVLRA